MHGGVERAIILLANALVKRDYDVEILCTYNRGEPAYPLRDEVRVTYLTTVRANKQEIRDAIHQRKFFSLIKEGIYAIKVLYLRQKTMKNSIKSITDGCIIATRNEHAIMLSKYGNPNVRKIVQLHHDHQFNKKYVNSYKRKYGNIDVYVLLTEQVRAEVAQMMKQNHHTKHVVIPHFLEVSDPPVPMEREKQVLAVGRLHEEKGFLRMLEAWSHTQAKTDHVLKIIGDGAEYEKLCEKIRELDLKNNVVLMGTKDHKSVMEEMGKSKAYLMTSHAEAFGFVLIESMSVGTPIVSYDVRTGPGAIVRNGVNGYLIPDGETAEFARKIDNILEHDDVFVKFSQGAVESSKNYKEDAIMEKWLEILTEDTTK